MKTVTAIAVFLLLAPRATLCDETDVKRLSKDVSELERRVSKTEDTLSGLASVFVKGGHYTPEMEKRTAEQQRTAAEQRAEFEAMTVDQLEDLILDLEDELVRAEKEEMEARKLAQRAGPSRSQYQKTSGDRQQRKAALREQFVASRAYNEAREKARVARSRLQAVRFVWEKKATESPDTEGQETQENGPNQ